MALLLANHAGGDPTQAQLAIAIAYTLAQLDRVADALAHGGEGAAYPALTTACSYFPDCDDATHETLKRAALVPDDRPPEGEATFDLDPFLAPMLAAPDPASPPPRPVEPVDRDDLADLDSALRALLSNQEYDYTVREAHARATACGPDLNRSALFAYLADAADQAMGLGLAA